MEAFPGPLELTVASALLLLSTTSSPISESLMVSNSASKSSGSSSSVISEEGPSSEIRHPRFKMVAVVARFHEMKLKVVRKRRSKGNIKISDQGKATSVKRYPTYSGNVSEITEASSCLSSGSSGVSSSRSYFDLERKGAVVVVHSSGRMGRRAEAILKVLSGGCASEVGIRKVLGDSPDTSKALRMLLKRAKVRRSGAGGRRDPYIYTIV